MAGVRQNYSEACEAAINKQINMELYASYVYQSMAFYFDRSDIALKNFFEYFQKEAEEERKHAEMFMRYQNLRGGRIVLQDIKAPQDEWKDHIKALEDTLALEMKVNESLLTLHNIADENKDAHLCDYLEGNFLNEQVDAISKINRLITNAKRCGDGLGLYQFNLHSMSWSVSFHIFWTDK